MSWSWLLFAAVVWLVAVETVGLGVLALMYRRESADRETELVAALAQANADMGGESR